MCARRFYPTSAQNSVRWTDGSKPVLGKLATARFMPASFKEIVDPPLDEWFLGHHFFGGMVARVLRSSSKNQTIDFSRPGLRRRWKFAFRLNWMAMINAITLPEMKKSFLRWLRNSVAGLSRPSTRVALFNCGSLPRIRHQVCKPRHPAHELQLRILLHFQIVLRVCASPCSE
jgi:hypothetical protein